MPVKGGMYYGKVSISLYVNFLSLPTTSDLLKTI